MIVFRGYLSGSAEQRYYQKNFTPVRDLCLVSLLIGVLSYRSLLMMVRVFPPFLVMMILFYGMCLLSPLWIRIPQKRTNTPNRITI